MKTIILLVGARPNFMKLVPFIDILKNKFRLLILHSGQHYDHNMSDIFFEQLELPKPYKQFTLKNDTNGGSYEEILYGPNNKYHLQNKKQILYELTYIESECLGKLGEIRDKIVIELLDIKPKFIFIFGDILTCLAGCLASIKANVKSLHVEAGIRSNDLQMPEEVHRILTDYGSNYKLCTDKGAIENLRKEGITNNVFKTGNPMIYCQRKFLPKALNTLFHQQINLKKDEYILITIHRPENTDNDQQLIQLSNNIINKSYNERIIFVLHPKTEQRLREIGQYYSLLSQNKITLLRSLGYLEMLDLLYNCNYVITDSGGLQLEATNLSKPCYVLRNSIERKNDNVFLINEIV